MERLADLLVLIMLASAGPVTEPVAREAFVAVPTVTVPAAPGAGRHLQLGVTLVLETGVARTVATDRMADLVASLGGALRSIRIAGLWRAAGLLSLHDRALAAVRAELPPGTVRGLRFRTLSVDSPPPVQIAGRP